MVSLNTVCADGQSELYPLEDALTMAGISVPTFYRWVRAGTVNDERVRGARGKAFLGADAIEGLRVYVTRVDVVQTSSALASL